MPRRRLISLNSEFVGMIILSNLGMFDGWPQVLADRENVDRLDSVSKQFDNFVSPRPTMMPVLVSLCHPSRLLTIRMMSCSRT